MNVSGRSIFLPSLAALYAPVHPNRPDYSFLPSSGLFRGYLSVVFQCLTTDAPALWVGFSVCPLHRVLHVASSPPGQVQALS